MRRSVQAPDPEPAGSGACSDYRLRCWPALALAFTRRLDCLVHIRSFSPNALSFQAHPRSGLPAAGTHGGFWFLPNHSRNSFSRSANHGFSLARAA